MLDRHEENEKKQLKSVLPLPVLSLAKMFPKSKVLPLPVLPLAKMFPQSKGTI